MKSEIHIGKIIKQTLKEKKISVTGFATMINYSRRNVYEIFDKKSIDTDLLLRISKLLNVNLFDLYNQELPPENQIQNENNNFTYLNTLLKEANNNLEIIGKNVIEINKKIK